MDLSAYEKALDSVAQTPMRTTTQTQRGFAALLPAHERQAQLSPSGQHPASRAGHPSDPIVTTGPTRARGVLVTVPEDLPGSVRWVSLKER